MASGKSLEEKRYVKIFYNKDGTPVRRSEPKVRMSKKERLKARKMKKEKI